MRLVLHKFVQWLHAVQERNRKVSANVILTFEVSGLMKKSKEDERSTQHQQGTTTSQGMAPWTPRQRDQPDNREPGGCNMARLFDTTYSNTSSEGSYQ